MEGGAEHERVCKREWLRRIARPEEGSGNCGFSSQLHKPLRASNPLAAQRGGLPVLGVDRDVCIAQLSDLEDLVPSRDEQIRDVLPRSSGHRGSPPERKERERVW